MSGHQLVGVDAKRDRCSCGDVSPSWKEHLAYVACELMGVAPGDGEHELTRADVANTRTLLAVRAARQDALGEELEALGLTEFVERSEWLITHRAPDEVLAWKRKWIGVESAPAPVATPKRKHVRRQFEPWQIDVAQRALGMAS
jgi:hypothetical protein